jgi:hypothetical protein
MTKTELDSVVQLGEAIYGRLRTKLEPDLNGQYVVIDVDTGEYEVDANHLDASDRAAAKRPDARLYVTRIGYGALCRIGRSTGVAR